MSKKRTEIEPEYKWALDEVYEGKNIDEEIEAINSLVEQVKGYRGELNQLKEMEDFLDNYSELMRRMRKLASYASMKSDEDTRNQEAQALKNKVNSLSSKVSEHTSFVQLEIQSLDEDKIEEMIRESEKIAKRDYFLREHLRLKEHSRSEEVEEVLSSLSEVLDSPVETYSMLSNADIEYPEVERDGEKIRISQSNFTKLLQDSDREFRREVYEKFFDTLDNYSNTIGTTFSKSVRSDIKTAEIRNYVSAREASLKPSNISEDVYDQLLETVNSNISVLDDHIRLKAEARDIDQLKMHDIYLPIPKTDSPDITYEEAKEHIIEALSPLGEEYVEKVRKAFDERWVDVYETEGKKAGAYSGGSYDTKPFILMNYQNDINSMFTLVHELGHSMHSHLTSENQPYLHSNYEIFVAEVASTVNETLLTEHLLENIEDKEFRKHVLSHALETYRSTLFRQTMFAEFEKEIHEKAESGEPVTQSMVTEVYGELKDKYYSSVEVDERIKKEWMRIPHFYRSFYVYQYATGISAANTLVKQIQEKGPEEYIEFLKSGGSKPPLELLKDAGVDMTKSNPVEVTVEKYREYIQEMREEVA